MVACLRSLQISPQVLLLDEPTASLDNAVTQQLETLIARWQQAAPSRACIWTSHDPAQLERVTTRQLVSLGGISKVFLSVPACHPYSAAPAMTDTYLAINNGQLALAAALIFINLILSASLKLGLAKRLGIVACRMVVQLLLVGYILGWVFALDNPVWVLSLALTMSAIVGNASVNRTRRRFPYHLLE